MPKIKEQITLVISYVEGMCSNVIEMEIKESEMKIEKVVEKVLNQRYGYAFYYKTRKYIDIEGVRFFAQEIETTPYNFIDPVKKIGDKITIRNEWATYYFSDKDNIIFTNDKVASIFRNKGSNPKIIRY